MHTKKLTALMEKETTLLAHFAARQTELQEAVRGRDWVGLAKTIDELQPLSARIEELDRKRDDSFSDLRIFLRAGEDESFTQVISRLSFHERQELLNLHRKLKIAVIRLKGACGRLGYYVRSLSDSMSQVLEELFPHRKGRLYSRSGQARAAAEESVIIDRKL